MSDISTEVLDWMGKLLKAAKKRNAPGADGQAGGPASKSPAAASTPDAVVAKGSALAEQLRTAMAAGGINVAIYFIGDPDKNNDKEFKRQAVVWAGNHGAFGLSGAQVKKDHAMSLSADPGKLVTNLLAAIKKELGTEEVIPVANVALFSHGGSTSLKVDSKDKEGGEGWTTAGGKVIKEFVTAVKPSLTASAKIHLFACDAAKDRDAGKGRDDAGRKDSFAEKLQEMTGAEIWGHEDARHTTGNPELVQVSDTNKDANAERYQLRDVLARKFLKHVDTALSEPQMGYLEQTLKISKWINGCMQFKGKGFTKTDNYQIFIEEVSMMGYDKLFDIMIPAAPPEAAVFQRLFPEHDQIDKLVEGAAAIHTQLHKEMDAKQAAIGAEKSKPGWPVN